MRFFCLSLWLPTKTVQTISVGLVLCRNRWIWRRVVLLPRHDFNRVWFCCFPMSCPNIRVNMRIPCLTVKIRRFCRINFICIPCLCLMHVSIAFEKSNVPNALFLQAWFHSSFAWICPMMWNKLECMLQLKVRFHECAQWRLKNSLHRRAV